MMKRLKSLTMSTNECLIDILISGRMNSLARDYPPVLHPLLKQARQWCMEEYPERTLLIPENQCFLAPSGTLTANLTGHNDGLIDLSCTDDRKVMVTASKDKTVRIWDLDTDTVVHIIDQHGMVWFKSYNGESQRIY